MASREKVKDRITISASETYNYHGEVLLVFSLVIMLLFVGIVIAIICGCIHIFDNQTIIESIIATMAILVIPLYGVLGLDAAVWKIQGKEEVSYNEKGLFISRKKLINHNIFVSWNDIRKISTTPKGNYNNFFAFYDWERGTPYDFLNLYTICIWTKKWKRIVLGLNLNEDRTRSLFATINELKEQYTINK